MEKQSLISSTRCRCWPVGDLRKLWQKPILRIRVLQGCGFLMTMILGFEVRVYTTSVHRGQHVLFLPMNQTRWDYTPRMVGFCPKLIRKDLYLMHSLQTTPVRAALRKSTHRSLRRTLMTVLNHGLMNLTIQPRNELQRSCTRYLFKHLSQTQIPHRCQLLLETCPPTYRQATMLFARRRLRPLKRLLRFCWKRHPQIKSLRGPHPLPHHQAFDHEQPQ